MGEPTNTFWGRPPSHSRGPYAYAYAYSAFSTTTELTTNFSNGIANALGLSSIEEVIEYIVRAVGNPFLNLGP